MGKFFKKIIKLSIFLSSELSIEKFSLFEKV